MKAMIFEETGEPANVLHIRDIPDPTPGPGNILVRVLLSPVHPADLHVMRGLFGRTPALPTSPGIECVGVVKALGAGVDGPKPGTRVVLLDVWASWRELVVAPADRVIPVPDAVSDQDAAQAMINPVTALVLTMAEHRLCPGEWLAQTAAGSTVGRLVLQLARSEGFRTLNLVRRSAQVAEIAELGGDLTLCTEAADWPAQFARAAESGGLKKAIDCVGGRVGAAVARGLRPGGRLLVYGALSSHRQSDPAAFEMPIFVPQLIYSASSVQGWFLFHWLDVTPIAETSAALRSILDRLATGQLLLPPAKTHRARELSAALAQAEASDREGKPLMDMTTLGA
ncbi:MAG TPA: zinc-dependent alcohol dehydrogenase family protein [Acetobacteraceae bacterium]